MNSNSNIVISKPSSSKLKWKQNQDTIESKPDKIKLGQGISKKSHRKTPISPNSTEVLKKTKSQVRNESIKLKTSISSKTVSKSPSSSIPVCDICSKSFTRRSGLVYHLQRVHNIGKTLERRHKCEHCAKTFLKRNHLLLHNQIHTGKSLYPCRHCAAAFNGSTGRRMHEEKVHGQGQSQGEGEDVVVVESTPGRNKSNRNKGHGPTNYKCSHCEKVFTRPSALQCHE